MEVLVQGCIINARESNIKYAGRLNFIVNALRFLVFYNSAVSLFWLMILK